MRLSSVLMLALDFTLGRLAGSPSGRGWPSATPRSRIHEALTSEARTLTPTAQGAYRLNSSDASR